MALQLLGETEAPAVVRQAGHRQALELALIENLQREELNPIELAHGYERLQSEFGLTQEQVAQAVGKDRATVANILRLLRLAGPVQEWVSEGKLTLGHARAILGLAAEREQIRLAERTIREGLSVRKTEQAVQQRGTRPTARARRQTDPHLAEAEERMQRALGTRVRIFHSRSRGWIRIDYYALKDLERLIARLSG